MTCSLKKINTEQIEKCKVCKHASANVIHPTKIGWCGLHRVFIEDPEKINKPKMPSIVRQGRNFAGSLGRHIKGGMKQRSHDEQLKCRLICEKCEFMLNNRCSQCGCYLKTAIKWDTKHCPINKW